MLLIKRLDNRMYQATGVVKLFLRLRLAFQKSYSTSQYVARFIVHLVLVCEILGFFLIFFLSKCVKIHFGGCQSSNFVCEEKEVDTTST